MRKDRNRMEGEREGRGRGGLKEKRAEEMKENGQAQMEGEEMEQKGQEQDGRRAREKRMRVE